MINCFCPVFPFSRESERGSHFYPACYPQCSSAVRCLMTTLMQTKCECRLDSTQPQINTQVGEHTALTPPHLPLPVEKKWGIDEMKWGRKEQKQKPTTPKTKTPGKNKKEKPLFTPSPETLIYDDQPKKKPTKTRQNKILMLEYIAPSAGARTDHHTKVRDLAVVAADCQLEDICVVKHPVPGCISNAMQ